MPRRRLALLAAALVAATVAAYLPLFANDFVAYDDDLYVTECPPVRAGLGAEGIAFAFGSFHGANWFPLTRLSWMLDAELFGVDPRAFHATSLALHCANAVLLLLVLARMTGAPGRSAFVAAVFALHPLHVESVAWAAARKDVLSGLFFLLALGLHERLARAGASRARRAAIAACMAAGLLAKPILVTLPLALLLLDAWPLERLGALRVRAALREKAWLFALAVAAGVVTVAAQHAGGALQALDAVPLGERLANAPVAVLGYLRRAFWPSDLAVFYPHPRATLAISRAWASAAALFGLTALALRAWPRRPWLAVGWLWFLVLLAPVVGIVQVGGQAMADRYTYLPLVGLAIAVGWGACDLARGPRAERALAAAALAALGALAVATWQQVGLWRDTRTLFTHALAVTDRNAVAHVSLGIVETREGDLEAGLEHARAALGIAPGLAHAHALLAEVRARQGRHEEAIAGYTTALELLPGTARWEAEIGLSLLERGRVPEGVARLEEALRLEPQNASLLANAGRALERAGRIDEAIAREREALRLRPDVAEIHGYLGATLLAKGDLGEARVQLAEAAALQPGVAAWRAALARAHAAAGDGAGALAALDAAIALAPEDGALRAERGALLDAAGRASEAAGAYREALRFGARDVRVLNNLAWILATSPDPGLRDPEAAVALAEEAVAASDGRDASVLDTLSLAYAAAARPEAASATAARALARAEEAGDAALAAELRARQGAPR